MDVEISIADFDLRYLQRKRCREVWRWRPCEVVKLASG
jgi:hypothetical protein